MQCKCGKLPKECEFFQNQYDCEGPKRLVPRMDCQNETPLSPIFAERIKWMETESRFAEECPDLNQELKHCPRNEGEPCLRPCSEYKDCFIKGTVAPWNAHQLHPAQGVAKPEDGMLDYFPDACAAIDDYPPVEPPNPKQAYGDRKVPLALIPPSALVYLAEAHAEGARKYGPYNWRESAVESMTYINAIMRHCVAVLDGEWVDPESGKPHLGLLMASAAILIDCYELGKMIDTRPLKGGAAQMLRDRERAG